MDNEDTRVNVADLGEFMTAMTSTDSALVFVKLPYSSPASGYILVTQGAKGVQTIRQVFTVLEPDAVEWAIDDLAARKDQDLYSSKRGSILFQTNPDGAVVTFTAAR